MLRLTRCRVDDRERAARCDDEQPSGVWRPRQGPAGGIRPDRDGDPKRSARAQADEIEPGLTFTFAGHDDSGRTSTSPGAATRETMPSPASLGMVVRTSRPRAKSTATNPAAVETDELPACPYPQDPMADADDGDRRRLVLAGRARDGHRDGGRDQADQQQ